MKIIAIQKCKYKTDSYTITIVNDANEPIELLLSMDIILAEQLNINTNISDEQFNKIKSKQRLIDIKRLAYDYVSRRKRTIKQVKDKLKENNYNEHEIAKAISFLKEFNLLDDVAFAKSYIKDTLLTKKYGKNKLLLLLLKNGINKEIATEVIEEYYSKEYSENIIQQLANKKYQQLIKKHNDPQKIKHSLFNHIISKGFSFEEAKTIIKEIDI